MTATHIKGLMPDISLAPYYIFTHSYTKSSAGIRVLHLLCHWLNRSGYRAYITFIDGNHDGYTHPNLLTPILTNEILDQHFIEGAHPVVVYPEIIHGNPTQSDCVARYLLNYPGLLGGDKEINPTELIFAFAKHFLKDTNSNNILQIPVIDENIFYPGTPNERSGSCFYATKFQHAHGQKVFGLPENCIEITRDLDSSQTPQQIAELFRNSEVFYSFEDTALGTEAILCHCPVILMPNPYFNRPEGLSPSDWHGIAWGNSESEVARAKATVELGAQNYKKSIQEFFSQLENFIQLTQTKAKSCQYTTKIKLKNSAIHRDKIIQLASKKEIWSFDDLTLIFKSILKFSLSSFLARNKN